MKIEFGRKGKERKELVTAIEKITEEKAKYLGAPSMAYQIGGFTVTKNGAVESEDAEALEQLTASLAFEGITSGEPEDTDGVCLWIPKESMGENGVENLKKLVESKKELFRRAFGETDIRVLEEDDKIGFPWFPIPKDADETKAYTEFVEALCRMAKLQKRVNGKEKPIENEKYEFRCFLLRLGFIGADYKGIRKVLLQNLSGSSAFKEGAKNEISE